MRRRRIRVLIGLCLLLLSLALLCWGYLPLQHAVESLRLPPVQLPTPGSWEPLWWGM